MLRILGILSFLVGLNAQAVTLPELVAHTTSQMMMGDVDAQGLSFKVGDEATYNLKVSFINGTMKMAVKAVASDSVTISQDLDLGFMGKQACEMVINPNTGETKSLKCNGQNQESGNTGDIEIIDSKEDTVKVPAGTFTCLYIKAHSKSQNADLEQWANPKLIPVFGMVKSLMPSQMGQVTIELKSFKKN